MSVELKAEFHSQSIDVSVAPPALGVSAGAALITVELPAYDGDYEVTPTETEQVLATNDKRMTDNVTVHGIPSDYVGSSVPRRTASDLSAVGKDVFVPEGYYDEAVSKGIDDATYPSASNLTVNPVLSINYNTGEILATNNESKTINPILTAGYATPAREHPVHIGGNVATQLYTLDSTIYTPTKAGSIIIPSGQFLTGDQVIGPIPEQYYDMSGDMAWLGKDAECIDSSVYSISATLSTTGFSTWTPSTTAYSIVTTTNAKTFSADLDKYQYYIVWECGCDPAYTGTPTLKAHFLMSRAYLVQEILKRPSSWANIQANNWNGNACVSLYTGNFGRYYGTTTGSVTYTWAVSYGFYFGAVAATFSNSTADEMTVTIKSPTLNARCSTTYMSTSNAAKVDQANSKWWVRGKLYRVKKNGIIRSIYGKVTDLING